MTQRIPQPRCELSPNIRTNEAQLLSVMLRTSRLTWVFGEPGTDTTALIGAGLMPLLQRRRSDRINAPPAAAAERPIKERRRGRGGPSTPPRVEAALYFDAWDGSPLSALKSRIGDLVPATARAQIAAETSLADMLGVLNSRFGFDVVCLFDRFEEFLDLPAQEGESTQFVDQLVDAVLRPELKASFLIAMSEAARPQLECFRARILGFDHNALRLTPIAQARNPGPIDGLKSAGKPVDPGRAASTGEAVATRSMPGRSRHRVPPPRKPIRVDEVYAFIEATLERTSAQAKQVTPKFGSDACIPAPTESPPVPDAGTSKPGRAGLIRIRKGGGGSDRSA